MAKAKAFPCVKKKQKKTVLVIVAPSGTAFASGTTVTNVKSGALIFTISQQELESVRKERITLSVKGPNALTSKQGSKSKLINPAPDPGDLTITLTGQGPGIDPVVIVPVEFVDDFDA